MIAFTTATGLPLYRYQHTTNYVHPLPLRIHQLATRRAQTFVFAVASLSPPAELSTEKQSEWQLVVKEVERIVPGIDEQKADALVSRAFGWGTQKFWRGRVKKQTASLDTMSASIDFLRDVIELDDDSIAKLIPKFPEVLALSVNRMRENVNYIQRTYPNLKGKLLKNAINANPAALGYDFDCEGDCKSECARCWVQF